MQVVPPQAAETEPERKSVRRGGAHRRRLVDMAVAVDPARQHELAGRVDLVGARPEPFRQRDDAAVADADIAGNRVGRRGDGAAANDEIVVACSHRVPPFP